MSFRGGQKQLLPFGLDWADITQNSINELEFPMPVNGEPTKIEVENYQQFLSLTSIMKDSSFYTGNLKSLAQEQGNSGRQKKNIAYLEGGVNDGLKRYSDKYRKKIQIGRSIKDHPFIEKFFPDELQSVISSKSGKKSLNVSKYRKGSRFGTDIDKLIKNAEQRQKEIMERLNEVAANNNDDDVEEDNQDEEDNMDDEFDDDDDDDYNAEKYFDDGDDFDEGDVDGDDEAAF